MVKSLKNSCFVIMLVFVVSGCFECGKEPVAKEQLDPGTITETENLVNLKTQPPVGEGQTEVESAGQKVESIKVTFIELGSVKCVPCKMMQPIMEEIEREYGGQVKIVFYDVWAPGGGEYSREYKVRMIPTQVFLDKEGKEYFRHEGFFAKEELIEVLKRQGVE